MAERIKIRRLEKTDEYIDREWAQVLSQRQHMLTSTDWTQLEDNELTFESRVRWNHWRNQVREVRRATAESREVAEARLKELENKMPSRDFIESRTARQKKYHVDLNSLELARSDAINAMNQLHEDWAINLMPENITLINAKFDEVSRYLTTKPKPRSLKEYPLMAASKKLNEWTTSQVVENVMNLKRTSTDVLIMMEEHRFKFTKRIFESKSIDDVINIIKNMHGY